MKFNKWTLSLAAVGAVSLASAARAEEAKLSQVQTALTDTTISGVVDIGYQQSLGNVRQGPQTDRSANLPNYGTGKYVDGFSLNQVIISLDKPLDETEWAAGYHIDVNWGDAAIAYDAGDSPLRQAYVALRTPLGNGIDWKVGVMDGVTGYESNTTSSNPNYTRSYGYMLGPTTLTGVLGQYVITDWISVQSGFVNRDVSLSTYGASDANRQSHSYVATTTLTAPESFGFMKGATLNMQTMQGFDNESVDIYSGNVTLPTPIAALKFGFAVDYVQSLAESTDGQVYGVYASYQATDKLGFALRGEYIDAPDLYDSLGVWQKGEELTATVTYNLWANVISRVEFRWDHSENSEEFYSDANGDASCQNAFLLAANVAYKF